MGGGLSLNGRAWRIADAMATNADALRVAVRELPGGARVIDAGVDVPGGLGAGRALAEICTGGLADIASPRSRPTLPSIVSSPPAIPAPIASTLGMSPSIRTTFERSPRTLKKSPSFATRPPCTTGSRAICFASSAANRSAVMQSATSA